jgi:hypothetical protein
MSVTTFETARRDFEPPGGGERWLERHPTLARFVLATLSARLRLSGEPGYLELARTCAILGLMSDGRMRQVAAAALRALGSDPSAAATWRFAGSWWYQRAACAALSYQADRLSLAWFEKHVAPPRAVPADGCILVSIHHFNQRLGFARLSMLVEELGAVAHFQPLSESNPDLAQADRVLNAGARTRTLSRFCHQFFGPRIYSPRTAPRRGIELLRRGGSIIVLSDYLGRVPASIFGKRWSLPPGAIWLAEQSGRPIVPFVLSPTTGHPGQWQLWCGEPIAPTQTELGRALEECIRRSPTTWTGWQPWFAAPDLAN